MSKRVIMVALCLPLGLCAMSFAAAEQEYEFKDGKWVPVAAPKKGTAEGELALIRQHVERGNGRRAAWAAGRFLKKYPDDPRREEVMSLGGRAEMIRGRYFKAYEWYDRQLTNYPNGQYAERALDRQFEIAEAFLAGKKRWVLGTLPISARGDGLRILGRIAEHVPGSVLAEKALLRIADHHYRQKDYEDATLAYDHFLEMFGRSKQAPYATLQAARATFASFHGVRFDETPLLNAQQRFTVFRQRYPHEARRANVTGILERIHELRAEKSYETGRFYERTRRKVPAKFYYRLVMRDYPGTTWSDKARQRLTHLGEPAGGPGQDGPAEGPAATTQPADATKPVPSPTTSEEKE